MNNSINLTNTNGDVYYTISIEKVTGKYTVCFILKVLDIEIYLSILDVVTIHNYLYSFYNSDILQEPLSVPLCPSNKYNYGFILMEPICNYGHMNFYEGMQMMISIEEQLPIIGNIDLDDVEKFYEMLQVLIRGGTLD